MTFTSTEWNSLKCKPISEIQKLAYSENSKETPNAIAAKGILLLQELGECVSQLSFGDAHILGTNYCFNINRGKLVTREDYEKSFKQKERLLFFFKTVSVVAGVTVVVSGFIWYTTNLKRSWDTKADRVRAQLSEIEEESKRAEDKANLLLTEKEQRIAELQEKNDREHVLDYGTPSPVGYVDASDIYDEIARRSKSSSVIAVKDGDQIYFYTGVKRGTSVKYDEVNRVDDIFTITSELTFTVEESEGLYADDRYYGMTMVDEYHNVMGTLYMLEEEAIEILGEDIDLVDSDNKASVSTIKDASGNPVGVIYKQ